MEAIVAAPHHGISIPWSNLSVAVVGAFVGAMFAFGFAIWLARRDRRSQATLSMISEFSSKELLVSRFVTSGIADQVRAGTLDIKEVAKTSTQGCPTGFTGVLVEGLTEHQHLSQLIGWYRRLAVHLDKKWVDRRTIAATLGGSFGWTLPFILELGQAAEHLITLYPSPRPAELRASWIYGMRYVDYQVRRAKPHRRIPGLGL